MFIAAVVCTSAQSDLDLFESSDILNTVDNVTNSSVSSNCYSSIKYLSLVLHIVHSLPHEVFVFLLY